MVTEHGDRLVEVLRAGESFIVAREYAGEAISDIYDASGELVETRSHRRSTAGPSHHYGLRVALLHLRELLTLGATEYERATLKPYPSHRGRSSAGAVPGACRAPDGAAARNRPPGPRGRRDHLGARARHPRLNGGPLAKCRPPKADAARWALRQAPISKLDDRRPQPPTARGAAG